MKIQQALNISMKKNINLFHIYLIFILALAGCAGQQVNNESASIYQQGMDAATQGDYATAFDLYKKSANMGNDDAQLALGEDLNGNLITIIRERAQELAQEQKSEFILIDGPPAVGFAVASAIAACDVAVVVIEPSPSAIHDLYKSKQLANRYEVPIVCLINKSDLNPIMTKRVKKYCIDNAIPLIGEIPFSTLLMENQMQGEFSPINEIEMAWWRLLDCI